jgi:hypothetical protein
MATRTTKARKVPGEKMVSIPQRDLDELRKDLDDLRGQQDRERLEAYAKNHALQQNILQLKHEIKTMRARADGQRHNIEALQIKFAIAQGYIQRCLEDDARRERGDKVERTGPTYRDGGRSIGMFGGHDSANWATKMAAE